MGMYNRIRGIVVLCLVLSLTVQTAFAEKWTAVEVIQVKVSGKVLSEYTLLGGEEYLIFISGRLTRGFEGYLLFESPLKGELQINIDGSTFIGKSTGLMVPVSDYSREFSLLIKGVAPSALVQGPNGTLVPGEKKIEIFSVFAIVDSNSIKLDVIPLDEKLSMTLNPTLTSEDILRAKTAISSLEKRIQEVNESIKMASEVISLEDEVTLLTQAQRLLQQAKDSFAIGEISSTFKSINASESALNLATSKMFKHLEDVVMTLLKNAEGNISQRRAQGYDVSQASQVLSQAQYEFKQSTNEKNIINRVNLLLKSRQDAIMAASIAMGSPQFTTGSPLLYYVIIVVLIILVAFFAILYLRAKKKPETKLPTFEELIKRGE
jgi:hypothetical protein